MNTPKMCSNIKILDRIKIKFEKYWRNFEDNKLSLFYLLLVLINHFAYGIGAKILQASEPDLKHIYGASSLLSIQNLQAPIFAGFMLGSLANFLHRWFNRQFLLVIAVLLIAISNILLPHYGELWVAYGGMVLNGIGAGAWECGSQYWLIEVWPARITTLIQVYQFVYNLGGGIAQHLVSPFAWGDALVDGDGRNITIVDRRKSLTIPFLIDGYMQSIIPIIFLALFFINRYQNCPLSPRIKLPTYLNNPNNNNNKNPFIPNTLTQPTELRYRRTKMFLIGLCIVTYYTVETSFMVFHGPIHEKLGLSSTEITKLNMIFTAASIASPLISAVISLRLQPECIISYHYLIVICSFLTLFLGGTNRACIYISNIALGYGFGPILASILAFADIQLQLSERIVSIYSLLFGAVTLGTPFLVRLLLQLSSVNYIFMYQIVCVFLSFFLFTSVKCWICCLNAKSCEFKFARDKNKDVEKF